MRASLTELKAICTRQTLPSEAEAPSRHHDASKLPDRHESEQRQRPDRFACCWEALVQALSFPAPGQARAHRAFRVASDPVKALARRLDRLPLLGSRRSRPLAGESEFRSLADAATISTPAERPTASPYRADPVTRTFALAVRCSLVGERSSPAMRRPTRRRCERCPLAPDR
jgi:hypothetical protein